MSKQKLCMLLIMSTLFNAGCMREINRSLTRHEAKESYYSGNFARSFRLTEAMAYEGDVKAEYSLGYMYYYGIGAPENKPLGMAWIREAALKGYPPAVYAIKKINQDPFAISQNESPNTQAQVKTKPEIENSAQDLNKLALIGDKNAQYTLGYMYYYGKGIAQNKELGMSLIKLSADNGNSKAIVARNKLEEFMQALADNEKVDNKSQVNSTVKAFVEPKLGKDINEDMVNKSQNVSSDEYEFIASNDTLTKEELNYEYNETLENKIEPSSLPLTANIEPKIINDIKESMVENVENLPIASQIKVNATAAVAVSATSKKSKISPSEYQWVAQLFTFSVKDNATDFVKTLRNKNLPVFAKHNMGNSKNLTIVFLGPVNSKQSLVALLEKIDKKYGLKDVIVRKDIKTQEKAFALKDSKKPQNKLSANIATPLINGNHFCKENPINLKTSISEEDPPFIMGGQFWDSLS